MLQIINLLINKYVFLYESVPDEIIDTYAREKNLIKRNWNIRIRKKILHF